MEENTPVNDAQGQVKVSVCIAPGCQNSSVNNKDVQFFGLSTSKIGKVLESVLGFSSRSMAAVCSQHFKDEDFLEEKYVEGEVEKIQWTLKPEAIQNLFPSQPDRPHAFPLVKNKTLNSDDGTTSRTPSAATLLKNREDHSLVILTERFMEILKSSPDGLLNLNLAADTLKVSKRRIYDITNVLEGVHLLKKKSKLWVQWMGTECTDHRLKSLVDEETKLDNLIAYMKQQICDLHENTLNRKLAYLTYDDIHNIPIFQDQAVFVIKAPPETILEVAHPKEAFQMHIVSIKGPVDVLGCTDSLDATQRKSQKHKRDGDYSNLPLRGLTKAAATSQDNANQNTNSSPVSKNPSEPTQVSVSHMSPEPTSAAPPHEVQNSPPSSLPFNVTVKEEMTSVNITPDLPLNENQALPAHEGDHLSSDVHMTDLS